MQTTQIYKDCIIKDGKMIKKYKLVDLNGYLDDILTKKYNIHFDEIYYFGQFQGYKIYLDNKKYPLKRGYYFTENHLIKCINLAISQKIKNKLNK